MQNSVTSLLDLQLGFFRTDHDPPGYLSTLVMADVRKADSRS
jgi:hypothetical protein